MTPNNTLYELNNLLALLSTSGIAIATTKAVVQHGDGGVLRITWATNAMVPGDLFRAESANVEEYRGWLRSQAYSALLFDGSLIQISYDFVQSRLIAHRLLYFPCPFDLDADLLDSEPISEIVDLYLDQTVTAVKLRSPVRFDFDVAAMSDTHPASHMTFEWSHCRVPVMSPMSVGHFVQFVFKNFYPKMWNVHNFVREWPIYHFEESITPEERTALHLDATG